MFDFLSIWGLYTPFPQSLSILGCIGNHFSFPSISLGFLTSTTRYCSYQYFQYICNTNSCVYHRNSYHNNRLCHQTHSTIDTYLTRSTPCTSTSCGTHSHMIPNRSTTNTPTQTSPTMMEDEPLHARIPCPF